LWEVLERKADFIKKFDFFGVFWIGQKLLAKNIDVSIQIAPRTCSPLGKQVFQNFLPCPEVPAKANRKHFGKNTGGF
jgi:hypothetical protein